MPPSTPPASQSGSGEAGVAAPPAAAAPTPFPRQVEVGWLIAILGLSLVLRLALVPGRWINPDEGAHLMDGRLALDGLLPIIDFNSRQIAYTYVLTAFLWLTRDGYLGVRLCLAAVTVANIYLVYLIARRLFDGRAAVAAALLYAVQPLAVIWAPIVHTEPVTIFPTCLAVYCLVRHLQTPGDRLAVVLAGVSLSLAFYVRESSLGVTAAVAFVLAAESWGTPGLLLRRCGLFVLGFLIPCAGFAALYARHLSPGFWWHSSLNPLAILLDHIPGVGDAAAAHGGRGVGGPMVRLEQSRERTVAYLQSVAVLCAGLLAPLAASPGLRWLRPGARPRGGTLRAQMLLYAWLGGLAAVYGYWSLHRGFFPQYAEEFLPALSILAGAVAVDLLGLSLPRSRTGLALGLLALYLAAAFATGRVLGRDVPMYACLLVPALGLGLAQLAPQGRARRWGLVAAAAVALLILASPPVGAPVAVRRALKLAVIPAILVGTYAAAPPSGQRRPLLLGLCACTALAGLQGYSSGRAGSTIGLAYETVWPPATVREVSALIGSRASGDDRVLSGAVIWELEAGKRPFANISHPLGFLRNGSPALADRLQRELGSTPPRFVVLDGYTESTYGFLLPHLPEILAARYQLVLDVPGLHYPVRVYQLLPGSPL